MIEKHDKNGEQKNSIHKKHKYQYKTTVTTFTLNIEAP